MTQVANMLIEWQGQPVGNLLAGDMSEGQLDEMCQWTIRLISTRAKNTALARAKDAGLTVGQWMERRIFEDEIMAATGAPGCDLVELLQVIAAIAAAPNVNFRRFPGLSALVREKIRAERGLPRIAAEEVKHADR